MRATVWDEAASKVARDIRNSNGVFRRGYILIPRSQDDGPVAWVFGNDNCLCDGVQRDLTSLRQQLYENEMEEVGFGVSGDGHAWAMVIRLDPGTFQTRMGKAFHNEMQRSVLEDALRGSTAVTLKICGAQTGWSIGFCHADR